jgi:DNA (cytosine-5)-methyltransferase 1
MEFKKNNLDFFQMRYNMGDKLLLLHDHISKNLGPLVEARMQYVPIKIGSDWRDLPNISIRLSDGSYTNKLCIFLPNIYKIIYVCHNYFFFH